MKLAHSMDYAATPEEVFAVLADPAFQEAKCAATAALSYSATVETKGDQTVISTERVLPADGLPDFAKSLVGETLKVLEKQTWSAAGADGSIWFTQETRGNVAVVTNDGVITEGKVVKGSEPAGITVAPDGNPWYAMRAANKIGTLLLP